MLDLRSIGSLPNAFHSWSQEWELHSGPPHGWQGLSSVAALPGGLHWQKTEVRSWNPWSNADPLEWDVGILASRPETFPEWLSLTLKSQTLATCVWAFSILNENLPQPGDALSSYFWEVFCVDPPLFRVCGCCPVLDGLSPRCVALPSVCFCFSLSHVLTVLTLCFSPTSVVQFLMVSVLLPADSNLCIDSVLMLVGTSFSCWRAEISLFLPSCCFSRHLYIFLTDSVSGSDSAAFPLLLEPQVFLDGLTGLGFSSFLPLHHEEPLSR